MLDGERTVAETVHRYDEIASSYNSDWRGAHDQEQLYYLQIFENFVGGHPKRILDAGCGTGKDTIYFAARGHDITGIDLSREMLRNARENAARYDVHTDFRLGDIRCIDFPDEYFDAIWSVASIVHLTPEDKSATIREFRRVLRRDGYLHIGVQNLLSGKHALRILESHLFNMSLENSTVSREVRPVRDITSVRELFARISYGYAYLDERHWFYPSLPALSSVLEESGFRIVQGDGMFARRLRIYARKE